MEKYIHGNTKNVYEVRSKGRELTPSVRKKYFSVGMLPPGNDYIITSEMMNKYGWTKVIQNWSDDESVVSENGSSALSLDDLSLREEVGAGRNSVLMPIHNDGLITISGRQYRYGFEYTNMDINEVGALLCRLSIVERRLLVISRNKKRQRVLINLNDKNIEIKKVKVANPKLGWYKAKSISKDPPKMVDYCSVVGNDGYIFIYKIEDSEKEGKYEEINWATYVDDRNYTDCAEVLSKESVTPSVSVVNQPISSTSSSVNRQLPESNVNGEIRQEFTPDHNINRNRNKKITNVGSPIISDLHVPSFDIDNFSHTSGGDPNETIDDTASQIHTVRDDQSYSHDIDVNAKMETLLKASIIMRNLTSCNVDCSYEMGVIRNQVMYLLGLR